MAFATIVVQLPDDPPQYSTYSRTEWPDEVERRLTDHINRLAFIKPEVIEYHREKITADVDEDAAGPIGDPYDDTLRTG
jgi:hypothetical protein